MYCICKTNFSVFKHQRSSATASVFSRKALTHLRILPQKSLRGKGLSYTHTSEEKVISYGVDVTPWEDLNSHGVHPLQFSTLFVRNASHTLKKWSAGDYTPLSQ